MNRKTTDFDLCYQCGWLGLCVIACPLASPERAIRPEYSTHPDIEIKGADEAFEIVIAAEGSSESRTAEMPAHDSL